MDSAFATGKYPSCTLADLCAAVAAGRGNPIMLAEIARRQAVEAGDMTRATAGERLRAAQARLNSGN